MENIPCSWIDRINIVKIFLSIHNLYIKHHPDQNNTSIFQGVITDYPKICREPEKTPSHQGNAEKEEQSRGNHIA